MSTKKEAAAKGGEGKKPGKAKKLIVLGLAATVLVGVGAGAGIYAGIGQGEAKEKEDPNRPKLVLRSEEPEEQSSEGGEEKEPAPKIGTVSVANDRAPVDPRKYEVTYFPIEQQFTANLSDGSGFAQLGISLSTYYDSRVIANIKRQIVPIRSAVLMTLSVQDSTVLSTPEGRQLFQRQLTRAINQVLREKEGFGGIDNVYFTNLVIQ
ncbi:flagellar basal body-associated FliL family protein [Aquisediminimonas profunda]|uniref:flagellar basal body-associated FliL family protein n=1 Tax=Aquisediminimonas profunda TaxID=1550733 RepID=UPI001C63A3DB|nr:flagellar basal body-associated FliL family protein [Aquisediminimonas profunda]